MRAGGAAGRYGEHVAALELLPVGAPRRDWRATTIADGMVIVRHPELPKALEIAHRFAAELHLFAGEGPGWRGLRPSPRTTFDPERACCLPLRLLPARAPEVTPGG